MSTLEQQISGRVYGATPAMRLAGRLVQRRWRARQIRSGVAGMSIAWTPAGRSASSSAAITV
jgi:hypothetical protein